jgi:hypothetical protein
MPLEDSDHETKFSIEPDEKMVPKINTKDATCFRIPLSLKVNGKQI